MKKILLLLTLLLPFHAWGQCAGPGPCVAGTINRASLSDTYPIVQANNLGGGLKSVSTFSQLSTLLNVNAGDLATTQDTQLIYQWNGSAWVQYPSAPLIQSFKTSNYTVAATDRGVILAGNSSSPLTFTLPATLPVGFFCYVVQYGAGSVIFSSTSGLLRNVYNFSTVGGQYNLVTLYVISNSGGNTAEWVLIGAASL